MNKLPVLCILHACYTFLCSSIILCNLWPNLKKYNNEMKVSVALIFSVSTFTTDLTLVLMHIITFYTGYNNAYLGLLPTLLLFKKNNSY